jgi:hypothetical protein
MAHPSHSTHDPHELAAPLLAVIDDAPDVFQFYVWCAGDAITFPLLHQTSAVIVSRDPISGATIQLMGTPEGARNVTPSTAVISWVRRPGATITLETVRAGFCNFTHFFASSDTASRYVAPHPELEVVPIDEVFQIGTLLWEREPFKSRMVAFSEDEVSQQ